MLTTLTAEQFKIVAGAIRQAQTAALKDRTIGAEAARDMVYDVAFDAGLDDELTDEAYYLLIGGTSPCWVCGVGIGSPRVEFFEDEGLYAHPLCFEQEGAKSKATRFIVSGGPDSVEVSVDNRGAHFRLDPVGAVIHFDAGEARELAARLLAELDRRFG